MKGYRDENLQKPRPPATGIRFLESRNTPSHLGVMCQMSGNCDSLSSSADKQSRSINVCNVVAMVCIDNKRIIHFVVIYRTCFQVCDGRVPYSIPSVAPPFSTYSKSFAVIACDGLTGLFSATLTMPTTTESISQLLCLQFHENRVNISKYLAIKSARLTFMPLKFLFVVFILHAPLLHSECAR